MSTPPVDRRTLAAIAPKLAELTETVLFGDIWARSELSPRERSLITLSALTAQGKTEQLPWHIAFGYQNGVLGIFRPKTTKCSGGPAVCGLQRGITFFEIPIWALFE